MVTIDGTPKVGRDLTANTDEWGSPVSSLAYQWLRDGEAIEGATEETYVVHSTDLDANLSVQVTGTTPEGATQTGTSSPVTVVIADDDSPGATVGPEVIGDAGGVYANDRVSAVFPEGVVTGSATLTVSAGPAIGAVTWGDPDNPDATMTTIYAQPLRVEHDAPLAQPVEVSWDLSYLTATEQAGAVPVRWDESIGAWTVQYVPTTLENGILTATISEFSDWTVATSQFILKLFGKRSDPPTCDSSKPVPTWAENYGLPDNDEGMPVSACLEGDGDNVRVKMVNNRTYAQIVRLTSSTDPGAGYATMNPGIPELTLAAVFRYLFNGLVNWDQNKDQLNATAIILAPGATGAITLAQPTVTGTTNISLDTKVEPIAVFSDVFYMMSEAIVGDIVTPGDDWLPNQGVALSWQTQELLQVLHECVFQLQGDPDFGMLLDLIKGCANSEVLQQLLQAVLKNQVPGLDKVAKLILSFSSAAKAIEYANYYTYGVDVAAGLTLGQTNVVWIQAVGDSGPPGRWTATCDDVGADEWALYQDVIWRYPITGTTRPGAHSDFAA
ncbi:MAG: hypothetical protein LBR33_02965, partial [Propionibacteriaceae bacterium]|nr:hypothetical protein [Propionibacteriaceae bacterium]